MSEINIEKKGASEFEQSTELSELKHSIVGEQFILWERQHRDRRTESLELESIPNPFAVECAKLMSAGDLILEIGVANGRDARYWAKEYQVSTIGMDIASEALSQLMEAAERDGTAKQIFPLNGDAREIDEAYLTRVLSEAGSSSLKGMYSALLCTSTMSN